MMCALIGGARPGHAQAALPGFIGNGVLNVCTNPTLPPMIFVQGADGRDLSGVDVDFVRGLADYWHVRLNLISMDFVGMFPSLESQRCDMIISGVVRQSARERKFDAIPYMPTSLVVVARAGTAPVKTMADLSGKIITAETGTSYAAHIALENDKLASQGKPPIIIQQYPTEDQVVQQVLIGRAYAFVSQDVELYFRQKQLHGKVSVILQPDYEDFRDFAIYIRKNVADRSAVESAVKTIEAQGALDPILKKWQISSSHDVAQALADTHVGFNWHTFGSALISPAFMRGAAITIALALCSHFSAILLAIPMALVLNGQKSILRSAVGCYVAVFRAAPTLLQLLFVWNALPQFFPIFREGWFTPFLAAWISLSLNEAAYQTEINRSALSAIDPGQILAGDALGLTRRQVYRHVIFPQALRVALPPTINEFISLIKTTSLASVISLQELMTLTQINVARTFEFTEYYAVALVYYLAMVFFFLMIQKRIEQRFLWADRIRASANAA